MGFHDSKLCKCGSGEDSYWEWDAKGIPIFRACPECLEEKWSKYRLMNIELANILEEFPQKNPAWWPVDSCFVVEASDLGLRPGVSPDTVKDPWNRFFPCAPQPITNEEQGLVAWHFTTTVAGQAIECRIFND